MYSKCLSFGEDNMWALDDLGHIVSSFNPYADLPFIEQRLKAFEIQQNSPCANKFWRNPWSNKTDPWKRLYSEAYENVFETYLFLQTDRKRLECLGMIYMPLMWKTFNKLMINKRKLIGIYLLFELWDNFSSKRRQDAEAVFQDEETKKIWAFYLFQEHLKKDVNSTRQTIKLK